MAIDSRNDKDWNRQIEYMRKIIEEQEEKNKDKIIEQLQQENQQLKKQKDDVVEYIKNYLQFRKEFDLDKVLRMLGEIDE